MTDFGRFSLVLAAVFCSIAILSDLFAAIRNKPRLAVCGRYATIGIFLCLTSAVISLCVLLLNYDFSVDYVATHSSHGLLALQNLSALWSGGGGALLLWLWLQVGIVSVVFFKNRSHCLAFSSRGRSIANFASAFLLQALIHDRPLFAISEVTPTDGMASVDSLSNLALTLYPPFLIVAYAALIIPFAWAFGFFKSDPNIHVKTMLSKARGWTLFACVFLTIGIVLALWGRYPAFTAAGHVKWGLLFSLPLIPWLIAIVMFFCYHLYRSRGPLGMSAAIMSVLAYSLCVYMAFLTRYGFDYGANESLDGGRGRFFVALLIHIGVIATVMISRRHFRKKLKG